MVAKKNCGNCIYFRWHIYFDSSNDGQCVNDNVEHADVNVNDGSDCKEHEDRGAHVGLVKVGEKFKVRGETYIRLSNEQLEALPFRQDSLDVIDSDGTHHWEGSGHQNTITCQQESSGRLFFIETNCDCEREVYGG